MNNFIVVLLGLILLSGCSGSRPDLGVHNGSLMPCPKTPNCVNSQEADEKHYTEPVRFIGSPQEAQRRLLKILASEQRTKILETRDDYIRAEFTSALFGFTDDVEFYFPETQSDELIIHVRSASRIGYSDLGVNRKRVEKIRHQLNGEL